MAQQVPPDSTMYIPSKTVPDNWKDKYEALQDLFRKYIDHVFASEGINFTENGYFSNDEEIILSRLTREGRDKFGNHPFTCDIVVNCDLIL